MAGEKLWGGFFTRPQLFDKQSDTQTENCRH